MNKVPFNVYDFFAYLASGGLIVATVDVIWGPSWLTMETVPLQKIVLLVFLAYVFGHMVGHVSTLIFESVFARRVLGKPSDILMGRKQGKTKQRLFPEYCTPLPEVVQERISKNAGKRDFFGEGEGLFLHAFSIVTRDIEARDRLDEFRNMFGFARNMAMAFFTVAIFMIVDKWFIQEGDTPWSWIVICGALAVGMFYRYLKFYRQYSYQLLVVYSELSPESE